MMNKRFIIKLAVVATAILGGFFLAGQLSSNPQSLGMWINSTATDVAVSINPYVTTIVSAITGVFYLVSLIVIIRKLLEERRYKKRYGESRTPVVFKASNPADN
jgi:hypothetical protein